MAKKKSNRKQQSPNDILERAETLFKRKSFQAALKEYRKLERIINPISETVTRHMAICRQELVATRAGKLVKEARRLLKKGDPDQASQYFEQAFDLTGDKHLADAIAELQTAASGRDLIASADQAEAAGDYSAAAEYLGRLYAIHPDNSLLCHRARCLTMAGRWQQAAATYAGADYSETVDIYNHGFTLARQQKHIECLNLWQQIQSEHSDFTEQKEAVLTLLLKETEARLDKDPPGREAEVRQQIQTLTGYEDSPAAMKMLSRCRSLRLASLWQKKRIREIEEMSDEDDLLNLTVLAIHAKAAYIQLKAEGSQLSADTVQKFIDFWLSALFNPISGEVCRSLFDSGLELVKKYAGYHPDIGKQLINQWEESFNLLTILDTLRTAGSIDRPTLLFTPALALQTGISRNIFLLIRENEAAFPDRITLLNAGAVYSPGAAPLLLVQKFDHDRAIESLDELEKDTKDPFVSHSVEMVLFACGLHALQQRDFKKAETSLTTAAPLVNRFGKLKKQLLAMLDIEEDWDDRRLTVCVNILSALQKSCPSGEIDNALCRVMTRHAVELFNKKKMNVRVLVKSLKKAAALSPGDEFTIFQLNDARCKMEMTELDKLFVRFKLSAASNLAAKSRFSDVRELFFEFIDQVCEQTRNQYDDQPDADLIVFKKLLLHAARVDQLHPVVAMLENEIAQKEEWK